MVRERKDWCISRQRKWGVPIPIFFCKDCGEALIDKDAMLAVADLFGKEGSNAWYNHTAAEILPAGTKCKKCGCTEFDKEKILWMFGSIAVHHMPLFLNSVITLNHLLTFTLRVTTSTEVGSSHHSLLPLLQEAEHLTRLFLLTV